MKRRTDLGSLPFGSGKGWCTPHPFWGGRHTHRPQWHVARGGCGGPATATSDSKWCEEAPYVGRPAGDHPGIWLESKQEENREEWGQEWQRMAVCPSQWTDISQIKAVCDTIQLLRIVTWFGRGSCRGLTYPTVLSYLVNSGPIFQSNCCAEKNNKSIKRIDKRGAWLIWKYQCGYC